MPLQHRPGRRSLVQHPDGDDVGQPKGDQDQYADEHGPHQPASNSQSAGCCCCCVQPAALTCQVPLTSTRNRSLLGAEDVASAARPHTCGSPEMTGSVSPSSATAAGHRCPDSSRALTTSFVSRVQMP